MPGISIPLDWLNPALLVAVLALVVAFLNARVPKIDSEYNICIACLKKSSELWDDYSCPPKENVTSEQTLIKILNNAEWALIYTNSRAVFKTEPVKHLEEEILEPFIRCLKPNDESSKYLKSLMAEHTTGKQTFSALKKALKRKGIKL